MGKVLELRCVQTWYDIAVSAQASGTAVIFVSKTWSVSDLMLDGKSL